MKAKMPPFKLLLGLICGIFFVSVTMSFIVPSTADKDVMIYCIAYQEMCGSRHVKEHIREKVPAENYRAALNAMEAAFQKRHPALKIKPGSSRDCCKDADNLCIMRWTKKNKDCAYDVVIYEFGTTHQEALDKANKRKNDFAGSDTQATTENFYW